MNSGPTLLADVRICLQCMRHSLACLTSRTKPTLVHRIMETAPKVSNSAARVGLKAVGRWRYDTQKINIWWAEVSYEWLLFYGRNKLTMIVATLISRCRLYSRFIITGSAVALHCCKAHSKINRKMEISTPCKILTLKISFWNLVHVIISRTSPTMQILV